MTKRSSKSSSRSLRSILGGLGTAVLLFFAILLAQLTGIDITGLLLGTTTPPAVVPATQVANVPGNVSVINVQQGVGAQKGFWQVYFTAPTGSSDRSRYVGGIETALASAINNTQRTLDIAAYEFNTPVLTQAVLDARRRGVRVRMVTDNEGGIEDEDSTIQQLIDAGIPVVDDARGALMHNKFMILDGTTVWTGSWNYTINDTYRNNNNALVLRSQRAVQNYQTEFDEMFTQGRFGPTSPRNTPNPQFNQDGIPIQIYFAPEDDVVNAINTTLQQANRSIRFMAFSFTLDSLAQTLISESRQGVQVQGIFERTGSETQFSELRPLRCAGLDVRQDGNPYVLHHKVFIVDDHTVIAGSFNFSSNATDSNDENLVIIRDPDLAAQYLAEYQRRWNEAVAPSNITC